jgi:hypothetical protein
MNPDLSRRSLMQAISATALSASKAAAVGTRRLPAEGAKTPKLCMNISEANLNDAGMRRIKQLGVDYVLFADSPPIPWNEADIRARMERLRAGGLTLANMMIPWMSADITTSPDGVARG